MKSTTGHASAFHPCAGPRLTPQVHSPNGTAVHAENSSRPSAATHGGRPPKRSSVSAIHGKPTRPVHRPPNQPSKNVERARRVLDTRATRVRGTKPSHTSAVKPLGGAPRAIRRLAVVDSAA